MDKTDRTFREDTRFRVLRRLSENSQLTHRRSATAMRVGAIDLCLRALTEKEHVKVHNFSVSNNKLRYAYLLTPQGVAEKAAPAGRFLRRKSAEYEALQVEIAAVQHEMDRKSPNNDACKTIGQEQISKTEQG
ncbi:MarR family EPS-associated transcriptional regulator [Cypionkella sp.]|uniref:MarR family EPS-associated transcriptional regulator n=1 Tax=Cypionkella sp. TaxID=2811411 RepID=UPI000BD1D6FF|nr:MarR family EPS-associated transcriptional regulator [Cypionkella sp.]MDO8982388.1 MarR family EPS-associated transcriptional regulator [Cypionkella sp.]MDP2050639.1 MarR family EPS-associated transcriptional regulator [Cypionkella sp.]OZA19911.1 MAG: MarR family EPS-associated transcriptional regulator [Rhodobacterales bacterium 17-64-5]